MAPKKVLAVVLAGGEGKRLMPLTADRAKPAVPFAGRYRLIDFALSNLVNSGYLQIVVLTQYKSHSLDRHISETWRLSTQLQNYVASVPAQQRVGKSWFLGSANAIYQSMNLIDDARPDIVVVIGADHVYRMDFSQMVEAHIASGASVSVAAVRQPLHLADQFGVIETDPQSPGRIGAFVEKPATTPGLPDDPEMFLASMGNYVFNTDALVEALKVDAERLITKHDMGGDIIPYFVDRNDAAVYDFSHNVIPGATGSDHQYWRDVGTLDSYYDANMDLISPLPAFNLYNLQWPIYTRQSISPPAKFVRSAADQAGTAFDSIVSNGVVISGGTVTGSVLAPDVYVDSGAVVTDSVLMDGIHVGAGAVVRRAIIDKFVQIPPGATIGVDRELDLARGFTVTASGLTVLSKGQRVSLPEPEPEPEPAPA
ncbi:glucose-1-phosphate adenylyltransferase [Arthrobacter sp. zg-ZUI100]|uniref:Glucose-1-phosphate adenylyltransferase n=1 Tax=Arthrobacter jiangjiafuii TaxID=2817475 RepID=A0A975QZ45_9MICC|nr:glucose-1-phosphate adenylyltransferase [Arthrobacter jiangjiafuii]MBP3043163.1 glucose-1-phosphate adenylyltransferase [Arthrobacter jiangjiafuii]QWC08717.1 glucose-1-phosphate adenylyltransferase [Arthrobacter jiangjiafuii]